MVAGGGPAGCAFALSLRRHAPELSVAVVEATEYEGVRIGETLPPHVRPLLEHLGVWDVFSRSGACEVHGTAAAWGQDAAGSNDFVFGARGPGWHVDRGAFDALLAREVERAGGVVVTGRRVDGVERRAGGWSARSGGAEIGARYLVDATGHRAAIGRAMGDRERVLDRLVAFGRFFEDAAPGDPRTLVEAFPDGWWYTAGLPQRRRVVVCVTDADVARRMRLRDPERWSERLRATSHVAGTLSGARAGSGTFVRPMHSKCAAHAGNEGRIAVGDAASSFDPLSSQGVFKALRTGIFGSYTAADALAGDGRAVERYDRFVEREFDGYLRARALFYEHEARWPDRPFWRRRRLRQT